MTDHINFDDLVGCDGKTHDGKHLPAGTLRQETGDPIDEHRLNAIRSRGVRVSRTTSRATPTESAINTSCSGSISFRGLLSSQGRVHRETLRASHDGTEERQRIASRSRRRVCVLTLETNTFSMLRSRPKARHRSCKPHRGSERLAVDEAAALPPTSPAGHVYYNYTGAIATIK